MTLISLLLRCTSNTRVLILNSYGDEIAHWKDYELLRYDGKEEDLRECEILDFSTQLIREINNIPDTCNYMEVPCIVVRVIERRTI